MPPSKDGPDGEDLLAPGDSLSHFRILEPIGAGGTGRVYRAQDTRVHRGVALKLISASLTGDVRARGRLVLEAEAAATLDHPHIGAILSVGESDGGRVFIVMELYEGATLERRIRDGPLHEETALAIASQAAAGLAHAHERGIVHRDVKPANILVTPDGIVKVLDFGLAKLMGGPDSIEPGHVAGTIHYMSPEQISGRTVDPRTDVWSLGVVLYELLTGQRPFRASRQVDVVDSILHDDPLPLSAARPGLRAETSRLVEKALLRRPAARGTMEELRRGLGGLVWSHGARLEGRPESPPGEKAVLVLAFVSAEPRLEDELFARGLTEAVIADLSAAKGIRVVSRAAGAGVRASSARIRAACREMDVEYVLEGSVQRDHDGDFTISARLVETRTDYLAWSARADARNILKTRESLATGVAAALGRDGGRPPGVD